MTFALSVHVLAVVRVEFITSHATCVQLCCFCRHAQAQCGMPDVSTPSGVIYFIIVFVLGYLFFTYCRV